MRAELVLRERGLVLEQEGGARASAGRRRSSGSARRRSCKRRARCGRHGRGRRRSDRRARAPERCRGRRRPPGRGPCSRIRSFRKTAICGSLVSGCSVDARDVVDRVLGDDGTSPLEAVDPHQPPRVRVRPTRSASTPGPSVAEGDGVARQGVLLADLEQRTPLAPRAVACTRKVIPPSGAGRTAPRTSRSASATKPTSRGWRRSSSARRCARSSR